MKYVDKNHIRIINKMLKLLLQIVVNSSIIIVLHNRIFLHPQETIPEKRCFLFFSYLAGRDCVAAMRESAKEGKHFFCAPSWAQFFISCGDYIVILIPTLFVVEYIF